MASYRDDRDALRDKAETLAQELDAARGEGDRKDAELAQNEAEISRLRKLAGERPPPRPRTRAAILVAVTGSMVILGGVVSFTMMRASHPPHPMAQPAPLPVEMAPLLPRAGIRTAVVAAPLHVRFGAKVRSVVGRDDVKVDQACEIFVDSQDVDGETRFDELMVTCGTVELHRLTQTGGAITSLTSWGIGPATDDPGRYILSYEDIGPRSGDARAQISMSSEQGTARIFVEGARRSEVVLTVDRLGTLRRE